MSYRVIISHLTNHHFVLRRSVTDMIISKTTNSKHVNTLSLTDFKAGVKAIDSEQDFSSKDTIGILGTPSIFVYSECLQYRNTCSSRKFLKHGTITPSVHGRHSVCQCRPSSIINHHHHVRLITPLIKTQERIQ